MMLFGGMPALVLTCRRADRQMSRHVGCVSAFGGKCHDISRTWREPDLWQMSKKKSRHLGLGQLEARFQSAPLGKLQACRLDHHRAAAGLRNDAGRSAARLARSPVRRTLAEAMRRQRRRCATLRQAAPLRIPSFRDRGRLGEAHAHPCLYTAL